jgi:biopolymer transport protein ExbB
MGIDSPATVARILEVVSTGFVAEAERQLKMLKPTTRQLFAEGLRSIDQPKVILEEKLQAVLLEQRLHFERRLPLLAVIATAAPLMGLLGTVVGMVKTFALITVFGTGNAAKLSSGISEVLVATELGLVVAIPTLVAHGFLAHRIQKNLSLLERYALQFSTAVEMAKVNLGDEPRREVVSR